MATRAPWLPSLPVPTPAPERMVDVTKNTSQHASEGISRRELLGRGVKLGGAVLWMTPVVQTFGMGRAFAAEPSGKCVVYCVKYEVDEGRWVALGSAKAKGNCFICPDDAVNGLPANIGEATVSGTAETGLTVTLPPGCSVADSAESGTPDELTGRSAIAVKCGRNCEVQAVDPGATSFTVSLCANGKGISHFEFLLKCCP